MKKSKLGLLFCCAVVTCSSMKKQMDPKAPSYNPYALLDDEKEQLNVPILQEIEPLLKNEHIYLNKVNIREIDVNQQIYYGGNTILQEALQQKFFSLAQLIAKKNYRKINFSLKNDFGQTVLDCAYKELANLTISIKIGFDHHEKRYCSVVRSAFDDVALTKGQRLYDIKEEFIYYGKFKEKMYTFNYAGYKWCFFYPVCSVMIAGGGWELCHEWGGWVDCVFPIKNPMDFRGRMRQLWRTIWILGGDECGFASYLFKK
jgi:hypothetical protein